MSDPQEVKNFRLKFQLSQQDFATMVGLSAKAVSNIEIGFRKPSRTILKIVALLNSMPTKQSVQLVEKLIAQSVAVRNGEASK